MRTPLLAIDTSGPRLQLALLTQTGIEIVVEAMAQGQAERLFPALAELLARHGMPYAQLRRLAVTTGPGSFTGLRIGISAARGLGVALGLEVIGVPNLLALSLAAAGPSVVLLDARREEAYFQRFSGPGMAVGEPALLPMAAAQALIAPDDELLGAPFVDIAALAHFAAAADAAAYPPEASYVRSADAKPQDKYRVARVGS